MKASSVRIRSSSPRVELTTTGYGDRYPLAM